MVYFKCKRCKEQMEAPESLVGQSLKCPVCEIENIVPGGKKSNSGMVVIIAIITLLVGSIAGFQFGDKHRMKQVKALQEINQELVESSNRVILESTTSKVDLLKLSYDELRQSIYNGSISIYDVGWTALPSTEPVYMSYNEFKRHVESKGYNVNKDCIGTVRLDFEADNGCKVFSFWKMDGTGMGLVLDHMGFMWANCKTEDAARVALDIFPNEYNLWVESTKRWNDRSYPHNSVRYKRSSYFFRYDFAGAKLWVELDHKKALESSVDF